MQNKENNIVKEIILAAGCGILGGLIGGALWFGLSFVGRLAFISGIAAGLGGAFGGLAFEENKRPLKLTIAILFSLGIFCAGIYIGIGVDIYKAFEGSLSLGDSIKLIPSFFEEHDAASGFILDSVIGLITYLVGLDIGIFKL